MNFFKFSYVCSKIFDLILKCLTHNYWTDTILNNLMTVNPPMVDYLCNAEKMATSQKRVMTTKLKWIHSCTWAICLHL